MLKVSMFVTDFFLNEIKVSKNGCYPVATRFRNMKEDGSVLQRNSHAIFQRLVDCTNDRVHEEFF